MENITAAISYENATENLSPEEFQKLLKTWFQEKGVISEMKVQLRYKMINILKNTVAGRCIVEKSAQRTSLAMQAINLIIAEFLLQNQFHYSLSLFNTEAAVANIFPEHVYKSGIADKKDQFRLDYENFLNVMELIGVSKTSDECKELVNLYYADSGYNSVLESLVHLLCKIINKQIKEDNTTSYVDLTNETNFIKGVGRVLIQEGMSPSRFNCAIENIKLLHSCELKDIQKKYMNTIHTLRTEANNYQNQLEQIQKAKYLAEVQLKQIHKEHKVLKQHVKRYAKQTMNDQLPAKKDQTVYNEVVCNLKHCDDSCRHMAYTVENLKKENEKLLRRNREQLEEINKLSTNYKDLVKDFLTCQKKIELLNTKLKDTDVRILDDTSVDNKDLDSCSSQGSESITERVLQEARTKLKQLEEESKHIEDDYQLLRKGLHKFKL
ncbi:unnamed protein product [Acanthoscelides obtectus]|uniref:LisH domain-containing protein n=1 Tax=Acanthoscelides obtectus TaxID=200917 RepID=A0A9P0JI99_ACAOB|nr:unnamed protein product [Acanthoscelides obtectus]CAK1649999.1 hypothetical protein AOBTE_LOCUS16535 [Acanthoscelides obtectus]